LRFSIAGISVALPWLSLIVATPNAVLEYTTVYDGIGGAMVARPITGESPLARLRVAAGMSQQQLADRLGTISEPGIHRWETGRTRPNIDTLPRLASTLGVSIEALVHAIVETPRRRE
jgi:DNA-binding XRE family transcriptional regulator